MDGRARAPAAGTVLNALATGYGSAFAIEEYVTAEVALEGETVHGEIAGHPEADTTLIEAAALAVLDELGETGGLRIRTESDVPMAGGLKSSSAAANATVLATLAALGQADAMDREAAARLGVQAAREAGVTVTGAFDDASASMLGGLTITDNTDDRLLERDTVDWDVGVWIPPEQAFSAEADVDRCQRIAPVADVVRDLAEGGQYATAMTINGLAFAPALQQPTEPMIEALPEAAGVSLSGTGPSYVAVGDESAIETVLDRWEQRDGRTIRTRTQSTGATIE
ncbi:shikimate kinase [Halodesulfurarchaeum sp. HSR-GB]|uniref:shikimate kinase n=1 Tax=Halodesulfurarchaeum sp. HSR-GB TaxID=3074077 RepID=UPI002855A9F1|nr:shikimate kinase [Halodesulfurarchaeum sp. HSR-GB]MDR5657500.1 shikimate kinase [Halodesulfurarchaeum sp. HSR-GB]